LTSFVGEDPDGGGRVGGWLGTSGGVGRAAHRVIVFSDADYVTGLMCAIIDKKTLQ
jgi:hypothetical protein